LGITSALSYKIGHEFGVLWGRGREGKGKGKGKGKGRGRGKRVGMACFFHVVEPLHNDVILKMVSYGCCMDMPKTCGQFPSFHHSLCLLLVVPVGAGHCEPPAPTVYHGRWMDGWMDG